MMEKKMLHNEPGGGTLYWINSAKGIGVLLVILGHFLYDSNLTILNRAIYSFHIPYFFILAGYVQKRELPNQYISKRAKKLLVPFLLFTLISIPLFSYINLRQGGRLVDIIIDSFYLRGIVYNIPIWFLVVMFEVQLISCVLRLSQKGTWIQLLLCCLFFSLGGILYHYKDVLYLNIFGFNRTIICCGFYAVGLLLKKIQIKKYKPLIALFLIAAWFIFGVLLNEKVSLYGLDLNNYYYFVVGAITGSTSLMILCNISLDYENRLFFYAKYSILFLGTQYYIVVAVSRLAGILGWQYTWAYNFLMITIVILYVWITPRIYRCVCKWFPAFKLINGEEV